MYLAKSSISLSRKNSPAWVLFNTITFFPYPILQRFLYSISISVSEEERLIVGLQVAITPLPDKSCKRRRWKIQFRRCSTPTRHLKTIWTRAIFISSISLVTLKTSPYKFARYRFIQKEWVFLSSFKNEDFRQTQISSGGDVGIDA